MGKMTARQLCGRTDGSTQCLCLIEWMFGYHKTFKSPSSTIVDMSKPELWTAGGRGAAA